jgi:hypothetical protein
MSKLKPPHDPVEAIGEAYELLLERALGEREKQAEGITESRLHQALERSRERAVELGELSRDQADSIYKALVKDLRAAGEYIARTGDEVREWFGFETDVLEVRLLELMRRGADQTTEELLELKEQAEAATTYVTGEVTGPGVLVCVACGERLHFHKAGHVPPCPKCQGSVFERKVK